MEYVTGPLKKMRVHTACQSAHYSLVLGHQDLPLNALIGKTIRLEFEGAIHCVACGRDTRKSYSQGYCYPCAQKLAECDLCIVNPASCHYERGTCRDTIWAARNCHQEHVVYLANTSGLKVGITRATQTPTRWLDQGATQALPIMRVQTRHHSGIVEALLREHVADRTDWRRMLKGQPEPLDLARERDGLFETCGEELNELRMRFGANAFPVLADTHEIVFEYPVTTYPQKVMALGFDKSPRVEGTLLGIKGQYLIFDTGVLNVRKHTGYVVRFTS